MVRRGPRFVRIQVHRHAGPELADDEVRLLAAAAAQRAGPMQVVPLRLVFAVAVEHLHAMVLAVRDVDPAVRIGDDVVHEVELARIGAGLAPALDQLSVRRVLVHAGIAVAVRHVDLALRRQRRVGAAVERLAAHERRGLARDADGEQHLAVGRALAHRVVAVVGAVEIVVGVDVQAVRAREQPLAPALDEAAVAVQHHHRVLAAIEHVDAVLAVDRDRADVGQIPAVGQLRPVFDHAIAMLARAQNRHVSSDIVFLGSHLRFAFERGAVFEAVIAGEPAQQLVAHPVVEDAADVLARDARHRGEIALRDLLADQDAARADVVAERFREAEQRLRDAAFQRQEAHRGDDIVGVAQAPHQQLDDVAVDVRMVGRDLLERGAADEAQFRVARRRHRGRARLRVDHRKLADQRAGTEDRQDALAARRATRR